MANSRARKPQSQFAPWVISRRNVLSGIGASALVLSSRRVRAADELVVADYGGVTTEVSRKAFYRPFEQASGAKIVEATTTGFAQLKAMVLAGNVQWDVISTEEQNMFIGGATNMLEPIDYSIVNRGGILEGAASKFGVVKSFYSGNLAYDTRKFSKPPASWSDFWDVERFLGPRGMRNSPQENVEFALMADGVPSTQLYPLDLPRAFKKLDQIKPHIKVWWTSGAQSMQIVADGIVVMTPTWNGRVEGARRSGVPVELVWNQGLLIGAPYVVPKGAPHVATAMKFINFALHPDRMADFARDFFSGPAVSSALPLVPKDVMVRLPTYEANLKQMARFNGEWYAQNGDSLNKQWESWIAG